VPAANCEDPAATTAGANLQSPSGSSDQWVAVIHGYLLVQVSPNTSRWRQSVGVTPILQKIYYYVTNNDAGTGARIRP
jgi:hypothetical protein